MTENVYTVSQIQDQLNRMRQNGVKKGEYAGFDELHEKYSIKRGSTTYLYAGAHQGKSQFAFEIMVNLAQYSGWKWAVYSPETGSPAEVFAELAWVYLRKPFLLNDTINATDIEAQRAINFLSEHFYIIDPGLKDMTIQAFYKAVEDIESGGIKIDGCLIDPFTEIKTDVNNGVRDDIVIGNVLTIVRKTSADRDYHTIVTVHTTQQQTKVKNGVSYVDVPTMNNIAGGMQWSRKGMMVLNVWRCPYGLDDKDGIPYEPNQVLVTITKAKPKAVGSVGSIYMYYDRIRNRYYTKSNGHKAYSQPDPTKEQQEQFDF